MRLLRLSSVGSTQDEAMRLVTEGRHEYDAVLADEQTEGRGRRGAAWHSPRGQCLAVSYILRGAGAQPPGMISLAMGAAVGRALEREIGEAPPVRLRWPNDVFLDTDGLRKVAGVLVETTRGPDGRQALIAGVGVNRNVTAFPEELRDTAISLHEVTGRQHHPVGLAKAIWAEYLRIGADPPAIIRAFTERDATFGKRVALPDGRTATAVAFMSDGSLLVRWDDGGTASVPAAQFI